MSSYTRSSYYADKVNEMLNINPLKLETILMKMTPEATSHHKTRPANQTLTTIQTKSILKTGHGDLHNHPKRVSIYFAEENTDI